MFHKAKLVALILICCTLTRAQATDENKAVEEREKLRKAAVVFLRETQSDVNGMRSLENRISFTAEMAGLMWFHDEREARAMYSGAIADYRDLLAKYDGQMNALGLTSTEGDGDVVGPMSFMVEPTDRSRVLKSFRTAIGVGQQIAMTLAEHDAELAYSFYYDSLATLSNPEFRKQAENGNSHFESQLLNQIAENNAGKAAQLAVKGLATGVTYQHIELLKKIHAKDPDKGVEFGAAIHSRLKTEKLDNSDFYHFQSLLEFGGQTLEASRKPGGKRAVYTLAELRDLAEILADAILARAPNDPGPGPGYANLIQKYSPGRAAQIRTKFKSSLSVNSNMNSMRDYDLVATEIEGSESDVPRSYSNSNSNSSPASRAREERENAERQLYEDVKKLDKKELPKEEREKIIAQARKILMQTPGRDKKIMGLTTLASQVAKFGDKDLASEIMKDAEALVSPSPKNYQDFLLTWLLASGYANTDPDRAFPILEETIGRANDTLSAFIKIGEFIDVAEEMIQDGEVQVGAFGGQMVRGLTRELGVADATIQLLAKANFEKTKQLTNRFDRQEIRVLAKMMVLRAILDDKRKVPTEEEMMIMSDGGTAPPPPVRQP